MELALAHETMARWQFGITTVYHFLFVPLTISLSALVAGLQTAWVRTGREKYFKATKFWGKLFLINIAMGVVTGIVQEFQFGMSWSNYSRFVGDIFGAPLAFEALIAFFFESTFIGLWIFGWDRLPKKLHLLSIWMVALGTTLSAYFILAANSWMQHPVGYELKNGRAQLTDFPKVLFQNTTLVVVFHTITAAFLVGGAFMIGIAAYQLRRSARLAKAEREPVKVASMKTSLRLGLVVCLLAGLGTAISGDALGKVMFEQQPMKMAAAEALWDTQAPAPFSIFAYGDVSKGHNTVEITIPGLLSFLAKGDFKSPVPGINNTNAAEKAKYGDKARNGDYKPNIPTTFWAFRWMIGFGMVSFVVGAVGLWLTRRRFWLAPEYRRAGDEVPIFMLTNTKELGPTLTTWVWRGGIWTLGFPLIACSWGWIFTEMGRQPWAVYGLMTTADAVSPGVSIGEQWTSLIVLTLLYGILAVIEVKLMVKYAKAGPTDEEPPRHDPTLGGPPAGSEDADKPFAFAY